MELALSPLGGHGPTSLCFFKDTATTEIYALSRHAALPSLWCCSWGHESESEGEVGLDLRDGTSDEANGASALAICLGASGRESIVS